MTDAKADDGRGDMGARELLAAELPECGKYHPELEAAAIRAIEKALASPKDASVERVARAIQDEAPLANLTDAEAEQIAGAAITALSTNPDDGRDRALEEAAKVADEAAGDNADREASALIAAEEARSTSGRAVEIEYAVGYAKRAAIARDIAERIRALKSQDKAD